MHGIEIFNGSGELVLSMSSRLARILGEVQTGQVSGSAVVPGIGSGDPFSWVTVSPDANGNSNSFFTPRVSIDKDSETVSWEFNNKAASACTIYVCLR